MRRKQLCAMCTVAIMAASMMMSTTAMAQESTIAVPHQEESVWDELALTNDDVVETGINIRSAANADSQVIGYLYHGGAAWVLNRGEEWTEIYSGGLTGFVKNDYLVYGEDAKNMAQSHGVEGVATTWDDVKLYSGEDGASEVVDTLEYGDSFILTQDNGHWLQVQNGADSTAYVSAEDVSRVLLLDTAVATDAVYQEPDTASDTYTEDSYTEQSYTDESYYAGETYTDDTYTDNSYTEETYTEDTSSYTEETYTDSSTGQEEYYDTQTEAASQDTTVSTDESYYDAATGIYYDASTGLYYDSGTGILYDAWWNPVNSEIASAPSTETSQQTEAPVEETESYVEETEASSSASSSASTDDTSLLAALIYCEAGNQSYEGMVAVGAVVMNRVYSPSFPNTISEVIYQGGQFTPASSGTLASALANGVPSACYDAAVAAIGGENPVGSALYFNTGSGKGMKIGDHQFY